MSFSPLSYIASNFRDFNNYWLKAYEPGTTTPKVMALDSQGVTQVSKLQLNADGFIVSAGAALVIPYVEASYDLWLFPTESEADANDTVNAERLADNILGPVLADLNAIARSLNVQDDQVIFSTDTTTQLDNILFIYDDSAEIIYAKPPGVITAGEKIVSTVGDQLTTTVSLYTMSKVSTDNQDVYPQQFGAVANAESTIAIQNAIQLTIETGRKLVINEPFIHSSTLEFVTSGNVNIEFVGAGELITDPSITDQTALWISHLPFILDTTQYSDPANRPGGTALAVDAAHLDRTITVADGSIFSKGGYMYVISTDDFLLSAAIKKGENRKINNVLGDVITLDGGIDDSYTAATTKCYPYNPPIVNIKNLKMTGADDGNDLIGLRLYECAAINIDHPTINGYNLRDLQIDFTVGGVVLNPNNDFADKAFTGGGRSQYSLVIASSRDINTIGGSLRGGRHSYSTGGYIPCRNLLLDGTTLYDSDPFSNDVAALDTHEGIVNFKAVNCTIYGGVNISGENLDFSDNVVYLSDELGLRSVSIRVYTSSDYIIADRNKIRGIDCAGGLLIRHILPNVTIGKTSQDDNDVIITTASNKAGVGIEPNGVAGCVIKKASQSGNHIEVRGTAASAPALGNYDINDLTEFVDIRHLTCKDNFALSEAGNALAYFSVVRNNGIIEGNHFEVGNANIAGAFSVRGFKELDFDKNHSTMTVEGLAANSANIFRDIDKVNQTGGSTTNSYYNGVRLLSVTEYNPVNVELINCVINPADITRLNAPFIVHSSIESDAAGVAGESYQCTVAKTGTGAYVITFDTTRPSATGYPVNVTLQTLGFIHYQYTDADSIVIRTYDTSAVAADKAFSFTSY